MLAEQPGFREPPTVTKVFETIGPIYGSGCVTWLPVVCGMAIADCTFCFVARVGRLTTSWFIGFTRRKDYNEQRPHSALDNRTPKEFAKLFIQASLKE